MTSVQRVLVIIVAAGMAVACSGSGLTPQELRQEALDELRMEIRQVVDAPERQAEALAVLDEFGAVFDEIQAMQRGYHDALRDLNKNYDATRDDYEALILQSGADVAAYNARILELRARMTGAITDEEWAALSRTRSRTINRALRSVDKS